MKTLLVSLYVSFFGLYFNPGPEIFSGVWVNSVEDAVVPFIELTEENGSLFIRATGDCGGYDCDWGVRPVLAASKTSSGQNSVAALFEVNDREIDLNLHLEGKNLTVRVRETVHEDEKRISRNYLYTFLRRDAENEEASATGSISGSIFGRAQSTRSIFRVSLYGPDNGNQYISTYNFSKGNSYRFENLPDGTYFMMVESKGATAIEAYPSFTKIKIVNGEAQTQNVELR